MRHFWTNVVQFSGPSRQQRARNPRRRLLFPRGHSSGAESVKSVVWAALPPAVKPHDQSPSPLAYRRAPEKRIVERLGRRCVDVRRHETVSAQGEQSSSHQNQRKKLRRHKLKGNERHKYGLMRKIIKRTPCVKKSPQEQQTHVRCRRHTKPTLPTGAHS